MIYSYQLILLFSKLLHIPSLDGQSQLRMMADTVSLTQRQKGAKTKVMKKVGS